MQTVRRCSPNIILASLCEGSLAIVRLWHRWLEGPYCQLCNVTDGSRYYDAYASACLVCGKDAAGQVATLICVVLAVLLLVGLFLRFRPDRKIKCLVRLSLRLTSLYTQISLRAKCSKAQLEPRRSQMAPLLRSLLSPIARASQVQAVLGLLPGRHPRP